jgi:hypothetical protein
MLRLTGVGTVIINFSGPASSQRHDPSSWPGHTLSCTPKSEEPLCGTRDSIELATHAPHAMLKLYPADDHCAMNHFDQWLELTQNWLLEQVSTRA